MRVTSRFLPRATLAVLTSAALALTACVESGAPLISNAKPLLGQEFRVHLYDDFSEGKPKDFHAAAYRWVNGEYVRTSGLESDAKRFVAEPVAAKDFVIQSTDGKASALYSGSDESFTTALISSSPSIWQMRTTRHAKGSAVTKLMCAAFRLTTNSWSWLARPLANSPAIRCSALFSPNSRATTTTNLGE